MKVKLILASLPLLLWVALAHTGFDGAVVDANLNAKAQPDHILLTWSNDPATTQTVSFRTALGVGAASVVYWRAGQDVNDAISKTAVATPFRTADTDPAQGSCLLWTITLADLDPMTMYLYAARTDGGSSATSSFMTGVPAGNSTAFTFLVFGDSQNGNPSKPDYTVWHDTVTAAYAKNPDARFLMNVGDLVEVGQSIAHWHNWFSAAQGVIDHIPEMPVQGNHETYVDNAEKATSGAPYLTSQFQVFRNGPESLIGQTYSFDYGDAHIAVLDSQEEEEAELVGSILPKQAAWLADDLARSTRTWKLVLFHKTPYYNKAARANETLKSILCPVCESHDVDVVFNGHDHGLSRTYPIKNDRLQSRPGEGTVYYVTGRSGAKTYNDLTRKIWDAFFYDPQDQSCYVTVRIDGLRLTVQAFKADGTLIDSYTIDKQDPSAGTISSAPARFNKTRTIVYGDVLPGRAINPSRATQDPEGTWFVDARSFMAHLGGTISCQDGAARLSLNHKDYAIPPDQVQFGPDGVPIISASALHDFLGFQHHYDETLNALFFVKPE